MLVGGGGGANAPKGPTHIKNPKRALENGAFWGLLGPFESKGPKRPQKAPISRALFGFFICVGPFGALELTSISSSLIYAKCFNDII